jgi:hypothetical protein
MVIAVLVTIVGELTSLKHTKDIIKLISHYTNLHSTYLANIH